MPKNCKQCGRDLKKMNKLKINVTPLKDVCKSCVAQNQDRMNRNKDM